MLTANEQIAEKFNNLHAPFIYRVHETPDMDKVRDLNKFLFNLGYKINTTKDSVTPKAFENVVEQIKGTEAERVVSTIILRTLKIARYEDENLGHFGIASKYYCHFTSPIRRYPDLFIHRVISKYIASNYNVDEKIKAKYIGQAKQYAISSSEREKIATTAEREAEDIKKAEYMQDKIGICFDGIISSITQFGIFVELDNTIEGMVRFENLGEDYYTYNEEEKILIGERTKEAFKIGQKMTIEVIGADKYTRRIDFKRVKGEEKC